MKIYNQTIKKGTFASDLQGDLGCVPIRKNCDGEYYLPSEMGPTVGICQELAYKTDEKTGPRWAKDNPVVRFETRLFISILPVY